MSLLDDPASYYEDKKKELIRQKKFEEALKLSQMVKKVHDDEKSPYFWYKKGLHLVQIGEMEEALECFESDLKKRGYTFEGFFVMGKVLLQLKRYEEALECFNKASEEKNQNFLKTSQKKIYLQKEKKFEKALLYSSKANKEFSPEPDFWYFKGITLLALKKFTEAHSCILNAVNLDENNSKYIYELAKCELFLGNETECMINLKKAINFDNTIKKILELDNDFFRLQNNKEFLALTHL